MSQVFVIRNQVGLYLSKQREWVSGHDPQQLYRSAHKDEAINTVFEVTAKDLYLRAAPLECDLNDKGQPVVEPGDRALVQAPEVEAAEPPSADASTATTAPLEASSDASISNAG